VCCSREGSCQTTRTRARAIVALGAAKALPPGVSRDTLLKMAQVWERLAEQHADNAAPLLRSGDGEQRPAIQQQQQIQPDDEDKN
jgi:hypothetical protein